MQEAMAVVIHVPMRRLACASAVRPKYDVLAHLKLITKIRYISF